jgi:hypothetical protein
MTEDRDGSDLLFLVGELGRVFQLLLNTTLSMARPANCTKVITYRAKRARLESLLTMHIRIVQRMSVTVNVSFS